MISTGKWSLCLGEIGNEARTSGEDEVIVTGQSEGREVFVIPSNQLAESEALLPRNQSADIAATTGPNVVKSDHEPLQTITVTTVPDNDQSNATSPTTVPPVAKSLPAESPASRPPGTFTPPLKALPANVPSWVLRLRDAEKIGESYRGYCSTDSELETVLLLHKQQTGCLFGTRQSPSPAKPATRLMWKSLYVPYDGIPFVNAGSRAIVMECQYGPRRKGLQPKKTNKLDSIDYKATCPARIYIKKVRKFPEYKVSVDRQVDKKLLRLEQEKAFSTLRKKLRDTGGVLRYYLQLPTEKAHLYHDMETPIPPPPPDLPLPPPRLQELGVRDEEEEDEEEEEDGGSIPSRLHPRVVEKIRELVEEGHTQVYSLRKQLRKFVEREMFGSEGVPERHNLCYFPTVNDIKNHMHEAQKAMQGAGVAPAEIEWTICEDPDEMVTLTLTPASTEVGGLLEAACNLSPEAVQLCNSLTCLQPKIFAQLQPLSSATPHPSDPPYPLGQALSLGDSGAALGLGPVVHVAVMEGGAGGSGEGTHHIVLENGQTIPVQIVDSADAALSIPGALQGELNENREEEQEGEMKVEVKEEVITEEEAAVVH
ncbi:calcium-responsive transcription factor [Aplochiton taeniatus]